MTDDIDIVDVTEMKILIFLILLIHIPKAHNWYWY